MLPIKTKPTYTPSIVLLPSLAPAFGTLATLVLNLDDAVEKSGAITDPQPVCHSFVFVFGGFFVIFFGDEGEKRNIMIFMVMIEFDLALDKNALNATKFLLRQTEHFFSEKNILRKLVDVPMIFVGP